MIGVPWLTIFIEKLYIKMGVWYPSHNITFFLLNLFIFHYFTLKPKILTSAKSHCQVSVMWWKVTIIEFYIKIVF